ncbi:AEC family transporter [Dictyobacter arantiisoli]|uniref:Transporter n=1 Tax=Dictyobacter arantiisoli TaxID=2014874 RepID=A0A5A5TIT2_9CHLR|nr:hypothetical protein [Dictyobacter arantiisoli]GCF11242.1 hypothetical protein KDI_48060 [Dictyobacter arantiisoli]
MFEKTVPLLLLFVLGIVLKHLGVLKKEDGRSVGQLLMNVIIPATVVGSLLSAKIEPALLLLPLAGLCLDVVLLGVAFLLVPLLGLRTQTKGAFLIAFPTLELGTIGYAVMLAVGGITGLTFIALYDLGNALFFFLVVPTLATVGRSERQVDLSMVARQFLTTPLLWAFVLGLLLNLLHIQIGMLDDTLQTISQGLLFLIMILIALEFEFAHMTFRLPVLMIFLKTGIGITLGVLFCFLFHFTGLERLAVVVAASLPPSLLTMVFAKEHDLDVRFLASLCSLALPVAIVVSSALASFTLR